MRLQISKTKNAASFYVVKSTYENGRHSSKIVEKLGTYEQLKEKLGDKDPYEWAKEYVAELNRQEKEGKEPAVIAKYEPARQIPKGKQFTRNGGYLFLERLYHELDLHTLCKQISRKHGFEFDLNSILSRLLYTRILYPGSKRNAFELSKQFIDPPKFALHQIYRALDVLAAESDLIQTQLYQNSLKLSKRNSGVLYYDCTNYFFEIEEEEGELKRYGVSKEHRPNPIVQMGLFMDGDGIPLAFSIHPGNTNEQITLQPLEEKILSDFQLSKFIVCTDSGLSSDANRSFNTKGERSFITTQSIKKLRAPLREWALEKAGWRLCGDKQCYCIDQLDGVKDHKKVFYKRQTAEIGSLEQQLIVTYSPAYRDYQRHIRERQITRALKAIENGEAKLSKTNQNDYKRFISKTHCTGEGEVASKTVYSLNQQAIEQEAAYDGFYAVCTNLSGDPAAIIRVNQRRWEIEECFRIMKSEFKARPVFLSLDERIKAHFMTCFLSLVLYRYLEKRLENKFSCHDIISTLRNMNFLHIEGSGYVPEYTRSDLTDALHGVFGFRTDFQIVTHKEMKKIRKITKMN